MSKSIGFTGPSYLFLTPNEMYREVGKLKQCHNNYKQADIYFLTKMKHVKFNEEYTEIKKNKIIIKIICAGVEKEVILDPMDHIYKIKHMKNIFQNKEELFFYMLHNEYTTKNRYLHFIYTNSKKLFMAKILSRKIYINILKYIYSKEIKVTFLTPYTVSIDEPILKIITDEKKNSEYKSQFPKRYEEVQKKLNSEFNEECISNINYDKLPFHHLRAINYSIDQIVNIENIDIGEQEILYIGQTEREPFARLLPHEKLQELGLTYLRNDKEAIVIHLFGFQTLIFDNNKNYVNINEINKLTNKEIITTLEAELINYFKPIMNSDYKHGERKNWKHVKKLKYLKYKNIIIEQDIDGLYCKFKTKTIDIENKNKHIIRTNI